MGTDRNNAFLQRRSSPRRSRRWISGALAFLGCIGVVAFAQEKKDDAKKDVPRIVVISPLGVSAGATATVKIRGMLLAEATEVQFPGATPPVAATVKSRGKADVVQGVEPADAGDTQIEVELTVPKEAKGGTLSVAVITPAGTTEPHALLVTDPAVSVDETEPNGGFRQPQALVLPAVVRGRIENTEDVDVFSIPGRPGQMVVAEVTAAAHGSALDALLTLYDARGNVLATNDDAAPDPAAPADDDDDANRDVKKVRAARARRDSTLTFRCPTDGPCFLSLLDANARGGSVYVYQLSVKVVDPAPGEIAPDGNPLQ